jgi:hypothetical protein
LLYDRLPAMSQYWDQSYPNKRQVTNQNRYSRRDLHGSDNNNSRGGRPFGPQYNQHQLEREGLNNFGRGASGNNHRYNNSNANQRVWDTDGRNAPTPFTASIQREAALLDPIPRRRQSNTDEEGFKINTMQAPASQINDPNRAPMELEKPWNQYTTEQQYKLLVRAN